MKSRFKPGDIVRHYKHETVTEEERIANKYTYLIVDIATDSDTLHPYVVYRALYAPFRLWVRQLSEFEAEVPWRDKCTEDGREIKQRFRYEKIGETEYEGSKD